MAGCVPDSLFSKYIQSYNEGQKCWDTSIKWPLFENWTYQSPTLVYPHALPPKPVLCFRPTSLSFTTNNIDSGVEGGGGDLRRLNGMKY